jgi:mannose-6-phosphate isomerase
VLYPLTFQPLFKERVWGGRRLESLYHKPLPAGRPIGESWEISDRPGDESPVANGPLAGRTLRALMESHAADILGNAPPRADGRFPLLIKLLDAQEPLSLQVHPPAAQAAALGGEPKSEMWFVAHAEPGATLFAGLRSGTTRAEFEHRIADGTVADCFHRLPVQAGDALFLPSGRVHALGAGLVLFEVQQNSDTTYRVHDWNRVGLDGKPRELHIPQSLASIRFDDIEPGLISSDYSRGTAFAVRFLVNDPLFRADVCRTRRGTRFHLKSDAYQILGLVKGRLAITAEGQSVTLAPGQFCLLPACLSRTTVVCEAASEFLHIQA